MLTVKRTIGAFIILFIAIPVLFAVIWAYGITKAVVSPEFISNLPQDLMAELPLLIEEVSADIETRWHGVDEDSRIWLKAFRENGTDLNRLLKESGLEDWIQSDVQSAFQEVGDILRGERTAGTVALDLRPLKAALKSPVIINEVAAIVSKLPPCSKVDDIWWTDRLEQTLASEGEYNLKLMPCRPSNMDNLPAALSLYIEREIEEIPDSVEMLHVDRDLPRGLDFTRWLAQFMLLIFIVPAFFIFLGALIGSDSRPSFLRWIGVPTLAGAGLVFLLTSTVTRFLPSLIFYHPDFQFEIRGYEFLTAKFFTLFSSISQHLFQPVNKAAMIISVIGIVLIALSYSFNTSKEEQKR